jgi:hypothetical protein
VLTLFRSIFDREYNYALGRITLPWFLPPVAGGLGFPIPEVDVPKWGRKYINHVYSIIDMTDPLARYIELSRLRALNTRNKHGISLPEQALRILPNEVKDYKFIVPEFLSSETIDIAYEYQIYSDLNFSIEEETISLQFSQYTGTRVDFRPVRSYLQLTMLSVASDLGAVGEYWYSDNPNVGRPHTSFGHRTVQRSIPRTVLHTGCRDLFSRPEESDGHISWSFGGSPKIWCETRLINEPHTEYRYAVILEDDWVYIEFDVLDGFSFREHAYVLEADDWQYVDFEESYLSWDSEWVLFDIIAEPETIMVSNSQWELIGFIEPIDVIIDHKGIYPDSFIKELAASAGRTIPMDPYDPTKMDWDSLNNEANLLGFRKFEEIFEQVERTVNFQTLMTSDSVREQRTFNGWCRSSEKFWRKNKLYSGDVELDARFTTFAAMERLIHSSVSGWILQAGNGLDLKSCGPSLHINFDVGRRHGGSWKQSTSSSYREVLQNNREKYNRMIIGQFPSGLPAPRVPDVERDVWEIPLDDGFVTAGDMSPGSSFYWTPLQREWTLGRL